MVNQATQNFFLNHAPYPLAFPQQLVLSKMKVMAIKCD